MDKPLSKAAQKAAAAAELAKRVEVAMLEAQQAATEAFAAFAKIAPRSPEGHIADMCGGAYVYAYKPTYAFRKAMVEAGAMERGFNGQWNIGRFTSMIMDQSITAAEHACNAARDTLRKHFPDEMIYATSYVD